MCNFQRKYQIYQIADAKDEHTYDKLQKDTVIKIKTFPNIYNIWIKKKVKKKVGVIR